MSGTYVNASSSGTHYKVMGGGASFTLSCTPSASIGVTNGNCGAGVTYSGTATPVTIQLTGVTTDHKLLTGQQCTATLSGTNGYKVTSYTWSVGGKAFKNYDTTAPNSTNATQLVPLGNADLNGPATGSTSVAPLNFYDGTQESLNVSCTASLTAPDGTSLSVSAQAPQITVLKPTVTWPISTGIVQYNSAQQAFGLYTVSWNGVTVNVPAPFSGGQCTFTQIVTPNVSTYNASGTATPYVPNNGVAGLDGGFIYGNTWSPPAAGSDVDRPAVGINGLPSGTTKVTASEAFTTWVMYKPDGGVWVPLSNYNWNWSETFQFANASWSLTQASPTTPPTYASSPTDTPPTWTIIH